MGEPWTVVRHIPARDETLTIFWIHPHFSVYNEVWVAIRARLGRPLDACWWCHKHFAIGDRIGLIAVKNKTNKVLCQPCVAGLSPTHEAQA